MPAAAGAPTIEVNGGVGTARTSPACMPTPHASVSLLLCGMAPMLTDGWVEQVGVAAVQLTGITRHEGLIVNSIMHEPST